MKTKKNKTILIIYFSYKYSERALVRLKVLVNLT